MACAGLQGAEKDHALLCAKMAIDMLAAIQEVNEKHNEEKVYV